MEINAIETAFVITNPLELEEVIYKSKTITPDQQSLLDGRNSHQYPVERELSDRKVTNSTSEKQKACEKSSLCERISTAEAEVNTEPTEAQKKAEGEEAERIERKDNLSKAVEISNAERTEMTSSIVNWLSDDNFTKALGKTRDEIFEEFGNELMPIAYIPSQFISLVSSSLKDTRIYCGKGYFIDHALRNHEAAGTQVSVEDADVSKYLNIQTILDSPDTVKETTVDGKRPIVFIKNWKILCGIGSIRGGRQDNTA